MPFCLFRVRNFEKFAPLNNCGSTLNSYPIFFVLFAFLYPRRISWIPLRYEVPLFWLKIPYESVQTSTMILGPRGGSNHKSRPGGQNLILITNVSLPVYLSSYPAINAIFLAFSKSGPEIFFRSVVFWYPKRLRKST